MLTGKHLDLYNSLKNIIPPNRLLHDELRTLAFGTDASFYRLIPKLVIKAETENDISEIIKKTSELKIPITFRAAGTSLSGQAVTDSVLVILGNNWRNYKIENEGKRISMQPGLIGAFANLYLSGYNRKLGPDPASINSAMIAGIAANNASGMTSGTANNIYNTLAGMKIIFADGSILDSNDEASRKTFLEINKGFVDKINDLSGRVKANVKLAERIKFKYRMKNTTGYSLNALVDFDDPIDIIIHLMIGSEGTLGFISEVSVNTVPDLPHKATSLVLLKNIKTACMAIPIFKNLHVDAAEIMDRAALRSVEDKPGMPPQLKELNEDAAALLVQTSAENDDVLNERINKITSAIGSLEKLYSVEFIKDTKISKKLWDVRKGLFPSVCKSREPGTTVIIEDVNFPIERLDEAAFDLQALFKKYKYQNTIIWGHSLAGNLHFVLSQDFNKESEILRYQNFMDDLSKLVIEKYDGSLKAEHGTGRNMAPYVKYEWGEEAYELMKEIKQIFDPGNILNSGVIINSDSKIHVKNLKPMPIADEMIDKCIECGFCEYICPSKNLTLTPRQRIAVYREISSLTEKSNEKKRLTTLLEFYKYYGDETCATDGLCAQSCPVDIDTGKFVKKLRADNISPIGISIARVIADRLSFVTSAMKVGLNIVHFAHIIFGTKVVEVMARMKKNIFGKNFPLWNRWMPKAADKLLPQVNSQSNEKKIVYFPSCISRTMGNPKDSKTDESLTTVTHRLLVKAGYDIIYPNNINNLCCGMPWLSKGFTEIGNDKTDELIAELVKVSENGTYPILYDTSPCLQTTINRIKLKNWNSLKLYEPVEFISDYLLDELNIIKQEKTITVHVTCSSTKMGLTDKFIKVAEACAADVIIPENVSCCGFAGDRGFSFPELNESALKELKPQLTESCREGYSNSKTCEIGLSNHSKIEYRSIIYLVDECTGE